MVPQHAVVEDQVLQIAALDGHHDNAMDGVERCDDTLRAGTQAHAGVSAGAHTDSAAQANFLIHLGFLHFRMVRVISGD